MIGYFCVKSIRVNTLQSLAEIPVDVKISVAQAMLANPTTILVLRLRFSFLINDPLLISTIVEKSVQYVGSLIRTNPLAAHSAELDLQAT